jgi:hypothetical protein
MSERDFWLMVRRALLMFVRAIELRYLSSGYIIKEVEEIQELNIR